MGALLQTETNTYAEMWQGVESYAANAPGERVLPVFLEIVGRARGHVLDAGTGSGKGALALQAAGFRVTCCDMTDAGLVSEARTLPFYTVSLWHSLKGITPTGAVEWVYCTDVLEHIPPQFTMLAVWQMLRVAKRGLFLSVSLIPDTFGAWVGKALHQTVQPYLWWQESLGEIGTVTDARDLIHSATFFVEPR